MGNLKADASRLMASLERDHGCSVVPLKSGHWSVRRRGYSGMVVVSHSPSDVRVMRNIKADLRRVLGVLL
jgi:hypothetical protein